MQRIAVNKQYGGFSLSPKGEAAYLDKKGKQAFFYKQVAYKHREGKDEYERVDADDKSIITFTTTKDFGERATDDLFDDDVYFSSRDIPRDDPDLIAVIEELGTEASGTCATLAITEIPDDINWLIDEYDGYEHVEEAHRTW